MDRKQEAVHTVAEARCAAESAPQRHSARMNELHACVDQQKAALASLQGLHERIVQAPAKVVNKAVVLFHWLQAGGISAAAMQGNFQVGTDLQAAVCSAALHVPTSSASSLSSMPRNGRILSFEPQPGGIDNFVETPSDACYTHQIDGFSSVSGTTYAGKVFHSVVDSVSRQGAFDPYHAKQSNNTCCRTESVSLGPALSFSEDSSESDPEDYESGPCKLLNQGILPPSQGRLASQLYMRKLALRVLRSWSTLRLDALDAKLAADAFCCMARTARALKKWCHVTVHLAQWREVRMQMAAAIRRRMVFSWVLHAWQSFVMDQHELLHKFLVVRCAHSRRLQLAALAGLWIHATKKRSQRAALCACRQRAARKLLRGWRGRVQLQKQLLERVLEFVAVCAQRLLHRCLHSWQERTKRRRKNRGILQACAKTRANRQCSAAFASWCQFLDNKALLQRVFKRAEKAWEEALQVCCSLHKIF